MHITRNETGFENGSLLWPQVPNFFKRTEWPIWNFHKVLDESQQSGALGDRFQKKYQISGKSSGKINLDILTMKIFVFLFSDPYKLVKTLFLRFGP